MMKTKTNKRKITIDNIGFSIKLLSLFSDQNISNINKNIYKPFLDITIKRLHFFIKNNKMKYDNMVDFEQNIWMELTKSNYFEYHKIIMNILIFIINKEYINLIKYVINKIHILPFIIFKVYMTTDNKEERITNLILSETFLKVYQVSCIMNVGMEIAIKKLRVARNIPIIDKVTGKKIITRQVKYPMVASEVCPFVNYINKCKNFNNLLYSILIIEKNTVLIFEQYKCNDHDSCVLYKYINGDIKHLNECEFWYIDNYWELIYPNEKELIN